MRLAQIIDELRVVGGAERLQLSLAEALKASDVELTVITLHDNDPEFERSLRENGARVVAFPASRFGSPSRAARLLRFLRRERFDVLHTHLVRSTVLGGLAGHAVGVPTVATLHNTRRNANLPLALGAAETWVLRNLVDRVVAVGWETARVHAKRLGNRPIDVIPNAVGEAERLAPAEREAVRRELGVAPGSHLILSVGRLQAQKGFSDMLRAFAATLPHQPNAELRIAGRGRLRSVLQAQIETLGLADRVKLLGLRRDVPRLLAASDVYLSAAAWEGLPLSLLEAMAAGLPIVATRVGDVPFVVTAETGTLVEASDVEALSRSLRRILDDSELRRRQSLAATERVAKYFSREAWARRTLDLYAELQAGAAGRPSSPSRDLPQEERKCA